MEQETIIRIEVLDTEELLIVLEGQGKPAYQFVYREAAGVYWDKKRHGFTSTPIREWSCSQWFIHIVGVVRSALGVDLVLSPDLTWRNVPEQQKAEILSGKAI